MFPSHITHSSITAICCALRLSSVIYRSVYLSYHGGNLWGQAWCPSVLSSAVPARMLNVLSHSLGFLQLNYVERQLCSSENRVKSFFKGYLWESWGNTGVRCKELCSKRVTEVTKIRMLKSFYWIFSYMFHSCHFVCGGNDIKRKDILMYLSNV